MRTTQRVAATAALAAALAAAPVAAEHHVQTRFGGNLGVGYDDNVGNALEDFDARDSSVVTGAANLDHTRRFSLNTALLLRTSLQGEAYEAFDGLSNARLQLMSRLSHRPAGGFYTPTFAGWIAAAAVEYGSALRDGFEYRGGFFVSEPLTTTIAARFGLGAAERRSDSDVFDLSHWSASLDLDWTLGAFTLYGGYQFQDGDILSTGSVPPKSSHIAGGCGSASACDPDDALDGQFAYRLDGETHIATLGLNVPLSPKLAIDAQARRVDGGAGENDYERWQGVISALMRF